MLKGDGAAEGTCEFDAQTILCLLKRKDACALAIVHMHILEWTQHRLRRFRFYQKIWVENRKPLNEPLLNNKGPL